MKKWLADGQPNPPPHKIKQKNIENHAHKYGLKVFVETGTYHGDMVYSMRNQFDQLYSIELSKPFFEAATKRFSCNRHITIIQGDSGEKLGELVGKLTQPTLFWLDGHYSAGNTAKGAEDTPILHELSHIFSSTVKGHVILIDDARLFDGDPGYPSLDTVKNFIITKAPALNIAVNNDCICITPAN